MKLIKSIPGNQINSTCFLDAKCTRLFVYIAEILGTEFHCEILRAGFTTKRQILKVLHFVDIASCNDSW